MWELLRGGGAVDIISTSGPERPKEARRCVVGGARTLGSRRRNVASVCVCGRERVSRVWRVWGGGQHCADIRGERGAVTGLRFASTCEARFLRACGQLPVVVGVATRHALKDLDPKGHGGLLARRSCCQ